MSFFSVSSASGYSPRKTDDLGRASPSFGDLHIFDFGESFHGHGMALRLKQIPDVDGIGQVVIRSQRLAMSDALTRLQRFERSSQDAGPETALPVSGCTQVQAFQGPSTRLDLSAHRTRSGDGRPSADGIRGWQGCGQVLALDHKTLVHIASIGSAGARLPTIDRILPAQRPRLQKPIKAGARVSGSQGADRFISRMP